LKPFFAFKLNTPPVTVLAAGLEAGHRDHNFHHRAGADDWGGAQWVMTTLGIG
jgi:hypothetical protein